MRLDRETRTNLNRALKALASGKTFPLKWLGGGSFRNTYALSDNFVLKINFGGQRGNQSEYRNFVKNPHRKARCMLVGPKNRYLVMERVTHTKKFERLYEKKDSLAYYNRHSEDKGMKQIQALAKRHKIPEWLLNSKNDGWQVGYNRRGELVWYDYQNWWGTKFKH